MLGASPLAACSSLAFFSSSFLGCGQTQRALRNSTYSIAVPSTIATRWNFQAGPPWRTSSSLPCRNTPGKSFTSNHGSPQPCPQTSGKICKICSGSICTTTFRYCRTKLGCTRFPCRMGCELHPNGSSTKFYRLAYNAHSFVSFDVDSSHWKRWQENELAVNVQRELSSFIGFSASLQYLLNFTCIDHMKRFIEYGRAALERREPPVATVFAHMRDPAQLLLVCRVTGFYPRPISVAWLRDGQEVPPGPGLNTSTILPNADLTYQLRSTLIVAPDDGHTYACRVRHCSLGTHSLLIPWGSSKGALGIGVAVVVLLTVAAACIATVWYYRHRC
ncbi:T-cell surface glycoprotein CD1b-3 isoform X2 [Anas platyrhynchos]|uniref:T-cell surface glycoprotein CD1b-3 isoform X2 n=1 Tax=Anas platyrhynchos TaxID=8839 RepID=UPI000F7C75CE|nr:antigen-presenting glycoprotein CD1d isoform X2 [Anas platyrhynchos]|eukprot:XP_027329024.1 antigen-presenting glycoprotein CD1d isoform X2 [Anas platyrhynchos]